MFWEVSDMGQGCHAFPVCRPCVDFRQWREGSQAVNKPPGSAISEATIRTTMTRRTKHIAFFQFKDDCTAADIAEVWQIIEALPTQIPGILNLTWGPNTSSEGLSDGFTHSFVMLFESAAARDAYLPHPAHQAAVSRVVPKLARVIVCDHECD